MPFCHFILRFQNKRRTERLKIPIMLNIGYFRRYSDPTFVSESKGKHSQICICRIFHIKKGEGLKPTPWHYDWCIMTSNQYHCLDSGKLCHIPSLLLSKFCCLQTLKYFSPSGLRGVWYWILLCKQTAIESLCLVQCGWKLRY